MITIILNLSLSNIPIGILFAEIFIIIILSCLILYSRLKQYNKLKIAENELNSIELLFSTNKTKIEAEIKLIEEKRNKIEFLRNEIEQFDIEIQKLNALNQR
jgi:hypothetical protein